MKKLFSVLLIAFIAGTVSLSLVSKAVAENKAATDKQNDLTLLELVLTANSPGGAFAGQLDTISAALLLADESVVSRLGGAVSSTVFVPTDDAFVAVGLAPSNISNLDRDEITRILLYHVTSGSLDAATVLSRSRLLMLNDALVQQSGGVLTDVQGGTANIIVTDLAASNGIAHAIDAVLLPYIGPTLVELLSVANSPGGPFEGQLDTLIAAILVADPSVLGALAGPGQLTAFLPTDAAFAELGLDPTTVGTLDQDFLTDVLLYHVSRFRLGSQIVVNLPRIRTLSGEFLSQSGGVLTDNTGGTANIIVTDIAASNGVAHVIDAVVLPSAP